jgi:hypothetical protein
VALEVLVQRVQVPALGTAMSFAPLARFSEANCLRSRFACFG